MNRQLLTLALVAVLFNGCASVQQGNDPIVVNAERDTRIAADTLALVAQTEKDQRANLYAIDPKLALQVKHGVDYLRANSKSWLQSARSMTMTYKYNRNSQNKANLQTALATLANGVAQAQNYLNQINQTSAKTP